MSSDAADVGDATQQDETLYLWEVHLVYSRAHESPSDETVLVEAPDDREEAIEAAREESRNNPPNVGPTYRLHEVDDT